MASTLIQKEQVLKQIIRETDGMAIAFSGGVDSTLLLDVAHEVLESKALALTACFACNPASEQQAARLFCTTRGIRHLELDFDVFAVPGFADNPPNRCYLCKHALLTALRTLAQEQGIEVLAEGSNLDDDDDYRPGRAAVVELKVISPLKEAGLTKEEIRELSRTRDLPTWDKPALACLATRLPYGTHLNLELIERIEAAEQYLYEEGALQVRVRVHDDLARIEVDKASIARFLDADRRQRVDARLRSLGFKHVALDLRGYQTGSMNAQLGSNI